MYLNYEIHICACKYVVNISYNGLKPTKLYYVKIKNQKNDLVLINTSIRNGLKSKKENKILNT